MTKVFITTRQEDKEYLALENYNSLARWLEKPNNFWLEFTEGGPNSKQKRRVLIATRYIVGLEEIDDD